jgi:hypothetical protein
MFPLFSRWRIGKGVSSETPLTHAMVMETLGNSPTPNPRLDLAGALRHVLSAFNEKPVRIAARWTAPNAVQKDSGWFYSVEWKGKIWCLEKKAWTSSRDEFRGDLGVHLRRNYPATASMGSDPHQGLAWHLENEPASSALFWDAPHLAVWSGTLPEEKEWALDFARRLEAVRLGKRLDSAIPGSCPASPHRTHRL